MKSRKRQAAVGSVRRHPAAGSHTPESRNPSSAIRIAGAVILLGAGLMLAPTIYRAATARAEVSAQEGLTADSELSTKACRTEESNLANVIVDAIRAVEKSDAAFMHGSAFSDTTIAKGRCSISDLTKAVQYREDAVVIVNLTGAQIKKALENGLKLYPQKSPEFLQVSGLTVTIDPNGEKEKRIVEVKVGNARLDESKKYTVAMPSPLANGALGYYKVWDKSQAIDHDTSRTVGQAIADYLAGKKSLGAKAEERLVFKK